jgi:serine/threonine-protein kinase HipA
MPGGRKRRSANRLALFMNARRVGTLTRNKSGALSLEYAPEWLDNANSIPISRRFLLREEPFGGDEVESYFENLLPDTTGTRERLAVRSGAQSAQPFDLLAAVGRDCFGALQILPYGEEPEPVGLPHGQLIDSAGIASLLRNLSFSPLGVEPGADFRFSLAGAHDKSALLWMDAAWYRPEGSTPTTHIFKPPIGALPGGPDLSRSPEVEWLSLEVCRAFGLPVAEARLARFEEIPVLIVERFDREWRGGRLYRRPVEDLCQALGVRALRKYERDGGPGIQAVLDFFEQSDLRNFDRRWFFKTQLVFWLLAAIDGHAKNFSIYLNPNGFSAAPLYDVLSADPFVNPVALPAQKLALAMCVGERRHYRVSEIQSRHWLQTAASAHLVDAEDLIAEVAYQTPFVLQIVRSRVDQDFPPDLLEPVLDGIERRSRILASA